MRSNKLGNFLLALLLVILSPVILLEGISIYSYLRFALLPSATAQLFDFVEIPRDTKLARTNLQVAAAYSTDAYNTDYHPVEIILAQRFPVGTSRRQIEQFSAKYSGCNAGTEKTLCSFNGIWYPPISAEFFTPIGFMAGCSDSVYVTFSFSASGTLTGIEIFGATNCI